MVQLNEQGSVHGSPASIFIVADSVEGEQRCRHAIAAIGARAMFCATPEEALARIDEQIALDAVIIDLTEDYGSLLDNLLEEFERSAKAGRYRTVISIPVELIDIVDGQISQGDIALLCSSEAFETAAALGQAVANRALVLHDIDRERDEVQLLRLSEEVSRIGRALAALSHDDQSETKRNDKRLAEAPMEFRTDPGEAAAPRATDIRVLIRMRRLRDSFFDGELFADPAWDMLLDLMAARLEGRQVAVSSLCIAASVPPTTALRWISTMTNQGLFVRRSDPRDGRRVFIDLSDDAAAALESWFAAARQNTDPAAK